jgi:hypothetical protein
LNLNRMKMPFLFTIKSTQQRKKKHLPCGTGCTKFVSYKIGLNNPGHSVKQLRERMISAILENIMNVIDSIT